VTFDVGGWCGVGLGLGCASVGWVFQSVGQKTEVSLPQTESHVKQTRRRTANQKPAPPPPPAGGAPRATAAPAAAAPSPPRPTAVSPTAQSTPAAARAPWVGTGGPGRTRFGLLSPWVGSRGWGPLIRCAAAGPMRAALLVGVGVGVSVGWCQGCCTLSLPSGPPEKKTTAQIANTTHPDRTCPRRIAPQSNFCSCAFPLTPAANGPSHSGTDPSSAASDRSGSPLLPVASTSAARSQAARRRQDSTAGGMGRPGHPPSERAWGVGACGCCVCACFCWVVSGYLGL